MDQVAPAAYNPHLQRVLKSFQSAAEASLSGPSRYMSVWSSHPGGTTGECDQTKTIQGPTPAEIGLQEFRKAMLSSTLAKKSSSSSGCDKLSRVSDGSGSFFSNGHSFPVPHMGPLFLPMDSTHSDKSDTVLEGQHISCFVVGGEKRLCLPQILNTVLQDFTLQQINTICDDLHIFCSRCNPQQLDLLKMTGVLPPTAPSCGLITKTDAERLCNALLHGSPEKSREPPTRNSFKVYHECFGKCKGRFNPELYTSPSAKCVDCCDCHGMFSPQKFVCHSHKDLENRTCHWGFDSANWRAYLLLAKDQDNRENMQQALDEMKEKFNKHLGYKKRRESPNHRKENDMKRARYDENGKVYDSSGAPWGEDYHPGLSAFSPWSPGLVNLIKEGKIPAPTGAHRESFGQLLPSFLQTGPPVLLNPDRVVPFNDTKRYDRHYAPNVSLAPREDGEDKPELDPKILSSVSSMTSAASSSLSSPSPIKVEKNVELDLSSSDESSFRSESVPSTPREDQRHLAEVTVPCESDLTYDRDLMLALVRRALVAAPENNSEEHEQITEKIVDVWNRQEDRVRALVQSRKHIIQEMELLRVSKQERLQEMSESRYLMRQELERLKHDLESRSREASVDHKRLRQEMEKASRQGHMSKAKYKCEIEALRASLDHYERLNTALVTDNKCLRQQLVGLKDEVMDLSKNSGLEVVVNGNKDGDHRENGVDGSHDDEDEDEDDDDDVIDMKSEEAANHENTGDT